MKNYKYYKTATKGKTLPFAMVDLDLLEQNIQAVLLPLLNDLREIRGRPLLSEGTLVLLNNPPTGVTAAPEEDAPAEVSTNRQFQDAASALRPAFQVALLGWIRDETATGNLAELARVSRALEEAATTDTVHHGRAGGTRRR